MSYTDIRTVLASMHTNSTLTDGASISSVFSITYDMSRSYVITNGVGLYLSAEQTAAAAAAQGIGDGSVAGYNAATIALLNAQYAAIFSDPNSGLSPITDITNCALPYVDGNTHYTYHTDGTNWSLKYNGSHSILYGTVSALTHSSTHQSGAPDNFMIEFPVALAGVSGYATNFSTFTLPSTSNAMGDPFITPMLC